MASIFAEIVTYNSPLSYYRDLFSLTIGLVGYFYLLTVLFYRDYTNSTKKPTIVFAARFGTSYFKGRENGYKPTMKEKSFSLLLSLGFMAFAFGLMMLIQSIIS